MNLDYAVERLYQTGWTADELSPQSLETLPDGRAFPSTFVLRGPVGPWLGPDDPSGEQREPS